MEAIPEYWEVAERLDENPSESERNEQLAMQGGT
jgi:hypothetical protein